MDVDTPPPPVVVAAHLEASPAAAPWVEGTRSGLLACEMVAHSVGVRGSGLIEGPTPANAGAGWLSDGWWETVLQDPRPVGAESLFLEVLVVAVQVPDGASAEITLHAFNCMDPCDNTRPHALSRQPLARRLLCGGCHILREEVAKPARFLRVSVSGTLLLEGVEAYCIELLPPNGSLRDALDRVEKAYAREHAVATKMNGRWHKRTFADVLTDARFLASGLRYRCGLDFAQGEEIIVGWCGPTCEAALLCFMSCALHHWCFVAYSETSLGKAIALVQPKVVVSTIVETLSPPATTMVVDPWDMISHGFRSQTFSVDCGRLGSLLFTSGSTGVVKAAARSHQELYDLLWVFAKGAAPDEAVHLAYQPFAHLNEQFGSMVGVLHGACVAFTGPATAYADANEICPTAISGVPRFFEPLLAAFDRDELTLEQLRSTFGCRLHSVSVGSAPVPRRLLEFLCKCFESSACSVTNGYGTTEVGPMAHNGIPNPNVELKCTPLLELGHDPAGNIGEIRVRVRMKNMRAGYYFGEATLCLDSEGFYCTGDIGCMVDGFLEVLGRVGNTCKLANGLFVCAERLEELYLSEVRDLDQILIVAEPSQTAVLGVAVLRARCPWSEAKLLAALQAAAATCGLPPHETLAAVILEAHPWTASGGGLLETQKLDRLALLDRYRSPLLLRRQLLGGADSLKGVRLHALGGGTRSASGGATDSQVEERRLFLEDIAAAVATLKPELAPHAPSQSSTVLVTGAAGLLGRQLVAELLRCGLRVVALVRSHAPDLPTAAEQVVGDLSLQSLGLGPTFDTLRVDVVLHCGAAVNWALGYARLRQTNVFGTREVVRFCSRHCTPLHFVSSVAVAGHGAAMLDPSVIHSPYALTKWAAERYVRDAHVANLPVAIYRPGMLFGSSSSGAGKPAFFPDRFIQGCLQAGVAPSCAAVCDVTPVDYAARVIVELLSRAAPCGETYNIFNPQSPTYAALADLAGLPAVPTKDFLERIGPDNALAPLLPELRGGMPAARDWGDETVKKVLGADYSPPVVDKLLVQVYVRYQRMLLPEESSKTGQS